MSASARLSLLSAVSAISGRSAPVSAEHTPPSTLRRREMFGSAAEHTPPSTLRRREMFRSAAEHTPLTARPAPASARPAPVIPAAALRRLLLPPPAPMQLRRLAANPIIVPAFVQPVAGETPARVLSADTSRSLFAPQTSQFQASQILKEARRRDERTNKPLSAACQRLVTSSASALAESAPGGANTQRVSALSFFLRNYSKSNTFNTHAGYFNKWEEWCINKGKVVLPADPWDVAEYLHVKTL